MKILHLITDLDVGGAEVMLFNLVKEHQKSYTDIYVIGLAGNGMIGDQIKQLGIPVSSMGMKPGQFHLSKFVTLIKQIKIINPDIIQTWMYHADLMGSLTTYFAGKHPLVWGLHHTLGDPSDIKGNTRTIIKINSFLSRWVPQKIVCCSNATLKSHSDVGYADEKMVVIPNGINIDQFTLNLKARRSIRDELKLTPDSKLIGMMARFHPQKDHATFIRAAELLHKSLPEVHFVLAGKDIQPKNSELFTLIKAVGLEQKFHLLGIRSDIPKLVAALDVATLSSAYGEALPITIGEAMACGVPCVVTDVGDSKEIIGQAGICVQPRDAVSLANGWKEILSLNNEAITQIRKNARQRIVNEYNLVDVSKRYLEVYMRLL